MQFRPAPEYTTIEVLFPEAAFGVVTFTKLTVHLSENTSLVPIGAVEDSALSKAVDADRVMARRFIEGADTRRKVVDLANRLINRLPWKVRLEPADRRTVWDQVLAVGAKKHRAATTWMIEVYWNCSKVADTRCATRCAYASPTGIIARFRKRIRRSGRRLPASN